MPFSVGFGCTPMYFTPRFTSLLVSPADSILKPCQLHATKNRAAVINFLCIAILSLRNLVSRARLAESLSNRSTISGSIRQWPGNQVAPLIRFQKWRSECQAVDCYVSRNLNHAGADKRVFNPDEVCGWSKCVD